MSKRHNKAFWQGWQAAKRGKWWVDNPYIFGSPLHSFWSNGFNNFLGGITCPNSHGVK